MADLNITIADLRTRITFQSPTVSADAGGAQVPSWANVATNPTVWARWINAHGQEVITSDASQSVQRATVTVRHRTDIRESWRILRVSDSSYWQIVSIDAVQGRNRWVELVVERAKGTL